MRLSRRRFSICRRTLESLSLIVVENISSKVTPGLVFCYDLGGLLVWHGLRDLHFDGRDTVDAENGELRGFIMGMEGGDLGKD